MQSLYNAVKALTKAKLLPHWHFDSSNIIAIIGRLNDAVTKSAHGSWAMSDVMNRYAHTGSPGHAALINYTLGYCLGSGRLGSSSCSSTLQQSGRE